MSIDETLEEGMVVYQPTTSFVGTDTFEYEMCHGTGRDNESAILQLLLLKSL